MQKSTLIILCLCTFSSCGLLGIYKDNISYDPEFNARVINKIKEDPLGKTMDSLIARIDAAKSKYPLDLEANPLIVETFTYEEYLNFQRNRLYTPLDNSSRRKGFKKYQKDMNRHKLIRHPKLEILYKNRSEYDSLDPDKYPYVLKTTNRLDYDPNQLVVTTDGHVYPWISHILYYIMDRRTNEVFNQITDLDELSK